MRRRKARSTGNAIKPPPAISPPRSGDKAGSVYYTSSNSQVLAWAVECYSNGVLTKEQTDGLDLRFGNDEALLEMIHRICNRDNWLGDTLAEGGIQASDVIGKDSFDYLIEVKGMSNLH